MRFLNRHVKSSSLGGLSNMFSYSVSSDLNATNNTNNNRSSTSQTTNGDGDKSISHSKDINVKKNEQWNWEDLAERFSTVTETETQVLHAQHANDPLVDAQTQSQSKK